MTIACAPVLLLLFNRPDLVGRAIDAIRQARPPRIYLAADGPRPGRPEDVEACAAARQRALESIDWSCEVKTLFREQNLGCARAVHGAVSWFFAHEAEGIVLEDDCVAAPDFFPFCTELLVRYRGQRTVFAISGDNFVEAETPAEPSYWFNGVFHCWGWASWRDRWADVPLVIDLPGEARIREALAAAAVTAAEIEYWAPLFDRVRVGTPPAQRIDSWAYPALFHVLTHRAMCATPARNLVTNVGFGADATHWRDNAQAGLQPAGGALRFPLVHPARVALDRRLHERNLRVHYGIGVDERDVSGAMTLWGMSLPMAGARPDERAYVARIARRYPALITLDQMCALLDEAWDACGATTLWLASARTQAFYRHPVWLVNGVFAALNPESRGHREALARWVAAQGRRAIVDFGGGYGGLARHIAASMPQADIRVVDPYPSRVALALSAGIPAIRYVAVIEAPAEVIIAQDVLEHVGNPVGLAAQLVARTAPGGLLVFANDFTPRIKCHVPSTFHLAPSFLPLMDLLGCRMAGQVPGCEHALVFERVREVVVPRWQLAYFTARSQWRAMRERRRAGGSVA